MSCTTQQQPSIKQIRQQHLAPSQERLTASITDRLPFNRATDTTKRGFVGAFSSSIHYLKDIDASLRKVIDDARNAAILVYTDSHNEEDGKSLFSRARKETKLPNWKYDPPDMLCAEAVAKPLDQIWQDFNGTLREECRQLVNEFYQHLYELVDSNIFGLLNWLPEAPDGDVCEYHYYRTIALQQKTGERERVEQSREESRSQNRYEVRRKVFRIDKTHQGLYRERHEHHLYDSQIHPWPARKLRKPRYIAELLNRIPKALQPHVFVVSGEMIREVIKTSTIDERDWEDETQILDEVVKTGRLWSPAVVLSDVVLAGWSDRDL